MKYFVLHTFTHLMPTFKNFKGVHKKIPLFYILISMTTLHTLESIVVVSM